MPSVTPTIRAVGQSTRLIFNLLRCGRDVFHVSLPPDSEHLRPELIHIANCVVSASQRQYHLDWDSKTYYDVARTQDGSNKVREKDLRDQFRPLDPGNTIRDPCIAVDKRGRVEAMYLPNAISPERQADITQLAQYVRPCLERNGPKAIDPESPDKWRQNEQYFRMDCKIFAAGLFTASPAWQMRGHEVKKKNLVPSKDLATLDHKPSKTQTLLQSWVVAMKDCALILSAVLAVVHPEQFESSLKCLDELNDMAKFVDLAEQWSFAFTAVSVISNRSTPEHRDIGSGGRGMVDLLLSIGGCSRTALELPGLGLRFIYDSGTIVLFSGHVHLHTVSPSERERMCIACYARKAVYHKFGLDLPGSITVDSLLYAYPAE